MAPNWPLRAPSLRLDKFTRPPIPVPTGPLGLVTVVLGLVSLHPPTEQNWSPSAIRTAFGHMQTAFGYFISQIRPGLPSPPQQTGPDWWQYNLALAAKFTFLTIRVPIGSRCSV